MRRKRRRRRRRRTMTKTHEQQTEAECLHKISREKDMNPGKMATRVQQAWQEFW